MVETSFHNNHKFGQIAQPYKQAQQIWIFVYFFFYLNYFPPNCAALIFMRFNIYHVQPIRHIIISSLSQVCVLDLRK